MSWARAERDSGAERVCLLLSVYPCPRREVGQVPSDAFAGANIAIEEGHGVRYFYEERIHLDRLGPFLWIYIHMYTLVLGSSALCSISSLCSFGSRWFGNFRLTNSDQIHLNLSRSSFAFKNLKTVGSR